MAGLGIDTGAFLEEAFELLSELEDSLLMLEESPEDQDLIGRVFRAMHTIKGSGAMFGFDEVAVFTHEVETVLDLVRNGVMPVDKELIDLTLRARDHIRTMLESSRGGAVASPEQAERIISGLRALLGRRGVTAQDLKPQRGRAVPPSAAPAAKTVAPHANTYRIVFQAAPGIFASGTNPLLLLRELRELGQCRVVALTEAVPDWDGMDPELCYTSWDIYLSSPVDQNTIRDVFIFVEDECDVDIRLIDAGSDEEAVDGHPKRLGEILVERGDLRPEELRQVLMAQHPIGQRLVDAGLVAPDKVQSALVEQQVLQESRDKRGGEPAGSVRVPSDRLDKLVDLVGELVTVQARLNQTSLSLRDHGLQLVAEEVERLTNELRDNTMSIRMLPIGTTFNKFKRLVRDLSRELGKQVEMTTEGGETELDKTVIDQLNDPLVHIIRNSIDHGVELPEERQRRRKPEVGRVHLCAQHAGATVLIRIDDDGKGLDPVKLRAKAVEKGLLAPDVELSDREAFQLIFAAGFSTAETVTNVSGRGVGMDVVRRSIDALRGSIEVQSVLGQGTSITLSLPLTLAIIEGLLVQIERDYFVLPLAAVEECVELTRQAVAEAHGRHLIRVRGEIVPYVDLRDRFSLGGRRPEVEQIVISRVDDSRVGFVVDRVIGQHQTVIKTLGKHFNYSDEFSGATILGDGTVALLLDLQKMTRFVEKEEIEATS